MRNKHFCGKEFGSFAQWWELKPKKKVPYNLFDFNSIIPQQRLRMSKCEFFKSKNFIIWIQLSFKANNFMNTVELSKIEFLKPNIFLYAKI